MSLYDGPRDVSEHLSELERRFGGGGYDHQGRAPSGWRAERDLARMRESGEETGGADRKSRLLRRIADRLARYWRTRRQTN